MVNAVVDANVIIAGLLTSSPTSASGLVLNRHRAGDFVLIVSPAAILEIAEVLALPHLRALHHLTNDDISRFCWRLRLAPNSRTLPGSVAVSPALTRDVTDTKWIALAIESDAEFLVTLDRRHLGRLKRVGRTKIVTPRAFLNALDRLK